MEHNKGKKIVTVLLAFSCIASAIILAASPNHSPVYIHSGRQLDSLIQSQIFSTQIRSPQIRVLQFRVDSAVYRKVYRIQVPSRFSKTLFHINLHKELHQYGVQTPAKVRFPEEDMDIYVYYNDAVQRTLRLITNPELDTTYTQAN